MHVISLVNLKVTVVFKVDNSVMCSWDSSPD